MKIFFEKNKTTLILILFTVFFQPAWAEPITYTQDKQAILVTSKEPTFIIKLKSNPTTGYSWFVKEYDSKLLKIVNHHYQGANNRLMGAPGFEFWTFEVIPAGFVAPHQTEIKFAYARPWEQDSHPTEVIFTISVMR